MAGVNKVILVGNLGRDPQLDYTPSGTARCRFSIATTEQYNDRDGQRQEKTEWHNIVLWARLAEIAGEYLKKGRQVYIEGQIRSRQYEDKDGQQRWITEIVGREMQMIGGSHGGGGGSDPPPPDEPDTGYGSSDGASSGGASGGGPGGASGGGGGNRGSGGGGSPQGAGDGGMKADEQDDDLPF
mgnify:FL=1